MRPCQCVYTFPNFKLPANGRHEGPDLGSAQQGDSRICREDLTRRRSTRAGPTLAGMGNKAMSKAHKEAAGITDDGADAGGDEPAGTDVDLTIDEKYSQKVTIDDFDLIKVLGKGSFGKVMLVRKKAEPYAGDIFAMKVLKKSVVAAKGQVEHTRSERAILCEIRHPYIVQARLSRLAASRATRARARQIKRERERETERQRQRETRITLESDSHCYYHF